MGALAAHLRATVPAPVSRMSDDSEREWERIAARLESGSDLESALAGGTLPDELVDLIAAQIADCIGASEGAALAQILNSSRESAFGRMLKFALRVEPALNVVTTNYDRLIEVHAARSNLPIDTMHYGHTVGRLDPERSQDELLYRRTVAGRGVKSITSLRPHVRLSKPHGSLDWFSQGNEHFRSDLRLEGSRRIIAPGGNKYRLGYDAPFDSQRERANSAIDAAKSLLFIGYGFNDDHLQTHLAPVLPRVPVAIVSRGLTPAASRHLSLTSSGLAIESDERGGCKVTRSATMSYLDAPLWKLETLVEKVLGL
ncbi:hypothetical protein DEJ30_12915 [Curtobacterium sp. MCPF17_003]|nr:hypothetical protein DEJ30_12915 [Curtobacterium sp. MCPF17_003]